MDSVSFVIANKNDIRAAAVAKSALPEAVEAGVSRHASELFDTFVRAAEAETDPMKRASLAIISLEMCAASNGQVAAPSIAEVKEVAAALEEWKMPDIESMAQIDVPVAELVKGGMSKAIVGYIRAVGLKIQSPTRVPETPGKTRSEPKRMINIERRHRKRHTRGNVWHPSIFKDHKIRALPPKKKKEVNRTQGTA
ncbi:hypothetical protein DIPPA_62188 [Diplonema papillatum]|nr:hypothetical protein DIPPA_62188 [Diplonema papillatum]